MRKATQELHLSTTRARMRERERKRERENNEGIQYQQRYLLHPILR